jgi:purine nucleosidase
MTDRTRSLVIDTDTGSDDAVALIMAFNHPDCTVRAVTVVAGNVPLESCVRNALITADLVGQQQVPVFVGLDKPLLRPLETAAGIHGDDGMSGAQLPEPSRQADRQHAVQALLDIADQEPGQHILVTLGPLSNIATALLIDPQLLTKFQHTYMMVGAADGIGNVNAVAEFNAWVDPEAAALVFAAPGAKTIIGWDVCRKNTVMRAEDETRILAAGPIGQFASDIRRQVREFSIELNGASDHEFPDPAAMAVALDESLIVESDYRHMLVSTDEQTRGLTFADYGLPAKAPTVRVITALDEAGFKAQLFAALSGR